MINIVSNFVLGKNVNRQKVSFKGARDDHNSVAILRDDKAALNIPVQRRIKEALTRLSKDGSPENVEFLLDVAQKLEYGIKPDSKLNMTIPQDFNYNYLGTKKSTWHELLKQASSEAIKNSPAEKRQDLQLKFDTIFENTEKTTEIKNVKQATATAEEIYKVAENQKVEEILKLREKILDNPQMAIKNKKAMPENYEKHVQNIKFNLDKFIMSPEMSLSEKNECLKNLSFMMSPEYKINPQLKNRKIQVLSEVLNDIAGQSKATNQKKHGSCAAVANSRKAMAAEYKLQYVQSILSELNNKSYMEVYDLFDYSKKVKMEKPYIDYNTALKRTYRILDASALNWMNSANKISNGEESLGFFNAFDAKQYDLFHDGHYLPFMKKDKSTHQLYQRGLSKLNQTINDIEEIYTKKNEAIQNIGKIEKIKDAAFAKATQDTEALLTKLGVDSKDIKGLTREILRPDKVANPELRVQELDETPFIKSKLTGIILADNPNISKNPEFNSVMDKITDIFVFKQNTLQSYREAFKAIKESKSIAGPVNEFKTSNLKSSLFEMEAYNRIVKGYELSNTNKMIYYRNKFNLDKMENIIKKSLPEQLEIAIKSGDEFEIDNLKAGAKIMNEIVPNQLNEVYELSGFKGFEGMKNLATIHLNLLSKNLLTDKETEKDLMDTLGIRDKNKINDYLKNIKKTIPNIKTEKQLLDLMRPIGVEDKVDLLGLYLHTVMKSAEKNPLLYSNLTSHYIKEDGTTLNELELITKFEATGKELSVIAEEIDAVATVLKVPNEYDRIFSKMEDLKMVAPKKVLDEIFANNNKIYEYKEKKTLTDYNIYKNNKYMSETFADIASKIDSNSAKSSPSPLINQELAKLVENLKIASNELKGFDAKKIETVLFAIRRNISTIEEKGGVNNPQIKSSLNLITEELKDKLTDKPALLGNTHDDFYKEAEKNYHQIRKNTKRELISVERFLKPELEDLYTKSAKEAGRFWVGTEGSSGLHSSSQTKIMSQLTGKDFYVEEDLDKGIEKIIKGRNSGIDGTSVSHKEPAMHAMYVYDVNKVKYQDEAGKIVEDGLLMHDNSWGPKEINGMRKDAVGNIRTNYARDFGENGGYFVKEGMINGASLKDLKYGQTLLKNKDKVEDLIKIPVFTDFILNGKNEKLLSRAAQIDEEITEIRNLYYMEKEIESNMINTYDNFIEGLMKTNATSHIPLQAAVNKKIDEIVNQAFNTNTTSKLEKNLQQSVSIVMYDSIKMYKENALPKLVKNLDKDFKKIISETDLKDPNNASLIKEKLKQSFDKNYVKAIEKTAPINTKKYLDVDKIMDSYRKQFDDLIDINNPEKGITSLEEFEKLPADHPVKILFNNMSVTSSNTKTYEHILAELGAHEPENHLKIKNAALNRRKSLFIELLNHSPYSKTHPLKINSFEDLENADNSKELINWIDKKFNPKTNEELFETYTKLTKSNTEEVKKLLDESSEADLGFKYKSPFELLMDVKNGRLEKKYDSAVSDYAYSKVIIDNDEKFKLKNLINKIKKNLSINSEYQKNYSITHQNNLITRLYNAHFESDINNVYKIMENDLSYLSIDKIVNKLKDESKRKYDAYPSFPSSVIMTEDAITNKLSSTLGTMVGMVKNIKESTDMTPGERKEIISSFQDLMSLFIKTNIQPKYQDRLGAEIKQEFFNAIKASGDSGYLTFNQNLFNKIQDKFITKDVPALLEHMAKTFPTLDFANSRIDEKVFENWAAIILKGQKQALLNKLEFLVQKDNDGTAHQLGQIIISKFFRNSEYMKNTLFYEIPSALMDKTNNNRTLKYIFNSFGWTQKFTKEIANGKNLKILLSEYEKMLTEYNGKPPEKITNPDHIKVYAKLSKQKEQFDILKILTKDLPNKTECKQAVMKFASESKPDIKKFYSIYNASKKIAFNII